MNRYIDAIRLFKQAYEVAYPIVYDNNSHERGLSLSGIAQLLDEQPIVDAVDVVRCKDCKYSSPNKVYGCRFEPFNTLENGERMYSDDFCSHGERKSK